LKANSGSLKEPSNFIISLFNLAAFFAEGCLKISSRCFNTPLLLQMPILSTDFS
jgi:hypothetical protein